MPPPSPDPARKTWAEMVQMLAALHHGGHFYPLAARVGVSAGLVHQWSKGIVKTPSVESVAKVCQAYGLDLRQWIHFAQSPALRQALEGTPAPRPRVRPVRPIAGSSDARPAREDCLLSDVDAWPLAA